MNENERITGEKKKAQHEKNRNGNVGRNSLLLKI